ncbi:ABC transporter ATP-binding protein [Desulfonatronum thiodismutans]|uniref:ABC transporter ATP-binding protein n=1 Tax=Desulfonatronum thiodismutans TaxID=159290 RepID=UPI0004ABE4FF|nr:ABC transporter ATP-binding protein [Desulfonatronum thiodismutans]
MKQEKRKTGLLRLIELSGTKKWWLLGSMLLSVLASVALFVPYVAAYHILTELAAHAADPSGIDAGFIRHWGYVSLGAILLFGVLFFCSGMLSHIAAFNILYELRLALARKLARLPMGFFTKRSSGDIKKVMAEDVERIELFVAHHIPDVTSAVVFPALILGYLLVADWRLALVVLAVFLAAVLLQVAMVWSPKMKVQYEAYHASLGRMNGSIVEYVRGIQVVKVFGRSMEGFERLQRDILAFRDDTIAMARKFAPTYTGFLTLLSSTVLFLIPASVALLVAAPSYPVYAPTVFLFLILGGGVFFPLLKLLYMGSLLKQNAMGVELIDEILNKPEIIEPVEPRRPVTDHTADGVVFEDVTFAYGADPVLKQVSFEARPGAVTALVGPSGAGKSTIAMLTARFWDVSGGEIRIGGVPIQRIGTSELMRHVSFVFQDNMLFFDTIEENIRMGDATSGFETVREAARAAQCHEFIEKLPQGYQTLVGEGGTYLSGGEQQRISLARAILKDAPVVILDEATAYADPENEGKILASFARLIKGKTVLVIAHRLSTITNADQILVVDGGRVVERGRHEALLEQGGLYSRMWQTYTMSREWVLASRGSGEETRS